MNNLISIDLLRCFAALSVFWYHQHIGNLFYRYTGLKFLNFIDLIGSTYAVPLFFLLSGFCIQLSNMKFRTSNKNFDLKRYYSNRFWRIYPPYLFAFFFSVCVLQIIEPKNKISFIDFIVHVINGQGFTSAYFNSINLVLWTITVEMAFYFLYPIYHYLSSRYTPLHALLFSLIVSVSSIIIFSYQDVYLPFNKIYFFTNLWFGWCFGAWLCETFYIKPWFFKSKLWFSISFLIIILFIQTFFINYKNDLMLKNTINILIWSPILIWIIKKEQFFIDKNTWLKIPVLLGVSSYSLYLLHEPLIKLKNYVVNSYIPSNYHNLFMVIGIISIPIICYGNYLVFEKPFIIFKKHK